MHWREAIYAGIAAAIIASVAQIMLWWAFWDVLPEILYRDVRLTAAIILGRSVLSPPMTFDGTLMFVATLIHFSISILYSVALAGFISRFSLMISLLIGIIYGLSLFVVNMYGFTSLFPWFAETRDWITMLSHAMFGLSSAGAYKALSSR
ncbi:MAG: sodium:proline symporter [Gammaproteobacteria bacterium]|nr:sodium:proline symporter [Gammaproteobacteria bacterium]